MNKISGFTDEISEDLREAISVLKELKIEYLEFRSVNKKGVLTLTGKEIEEVRKIIEDEGLKVSALASPVGKIKIEEDFSKTLEDLKKAIEYAQILKTNYIRIFSFYIEREEIFKYREEVLRRIKKMTEIAQKEKIVLLHENEKDIYGDVKERCLEILKYVNSKNLRCTFDPANFIQTKDIPYPDAYEMLKDFIEYLHIKDACKKTGEVKVAGEGDGNFKELISALKKKNFSGFLSIEPHLDNSKPGGGPENFKRAYRALKNILEQT